MTVLIYTLFFAALIGFALNLLVATCGTDRQKGPAAAWSGLCFLAGCFIILIGATTGHL